MPLTAAQDRQVQPNTQSTKSRQPLAASVRPFQGSLLGLKTDGFVRALAAGDVLLGIAERTTDVEDVSAADGGCSANVDRGVQTIVVPLTGVVRADVGKRRAVYASDDGTFAFTPSGSTFVGYVIGVWATNFAVVQMLAHHFVAPAPGACGLRDLADADATLTTADLDKILRQANTTTRTLTLPPAADCAGHFLTVVKNTAVAFAIVLDGNAAETIDGGATLSMAAGAARDRVTIYSDGTAWSRVA
jgi:hypothetical protein